MGQTSLFGAMTCEPESLPRVAEWDEKTKLTYEKEALGFYVSGHPMDKYAGEMKRYVPTTVAEVKGLAGPREVTLGGIVARLEVKVTKTGQGKLAIVALEDLTGQAELVVPPAVFDGAEAALRGYDPVWVRAFLSPEFDEDRDEGQGGEGGQRRSRSRLRAMQIVPLGELRKKSVARVILHVSTDHLQGGNATRLRRVLEGHPGRCLVHLEITNPETGVQTSVAADDSLKVAPDDALLGDLAYQFPEINVSLG
jgi:DNA polymerase-3 subunit alpha